MLSELLPPGYLVNDDETFPASAAWLRRATETVYNFDVAQRYPQTVRDLARLNDEEVDPTNERTMAAAFDWIRNGAFNLRAPKVYDEQTANRILDYSWTVGVQKVYANKETAFVGNAEAAMQKLRQTLREIPL